MGNNGFYVKAVQNINNKISVSVIAANKLLNFSANSSSNTCSERGVVQGCGPIRKVKTKDLT